MKGRKFSRKPVFTVIAWDAAGREAHGSDHHNRAEAAVLAAAINRVSGDYTAVLMYKYNRCGQMRSCTKVISFSRRRNHAGDTDDLQ